MREANKSRLVKLTKLDAARRQIESAIWLWFLDSDIVSVYTLTSAAHRILRELAEHRGVTPLAFTAEYFPRPGDKDRSHSLRDAEVFFQQAKNAEMYGFDEVWIELYLFDAVMAYANLFEHDSRSALMSTFVVRFGVQRPDLFAPDAFPLLEKTIGKTFNIERLEQLSKLEFLKEFFGCLERPAA